MTSQNKTLERLHLIWLNRKAALQAATVIFVLMATWIVFMKPIYVSGTSLFPKDGQNLSGSAQLLGAVGLGPASNSMSTRIEILLRSPEQAERAIVRDSLLPVLYPKLWDAKTRTWKDGIQPNLRKAGERLSKQVIVSGGKGFIDVAVEASDPEVAATLLASHLRGLADRMRADSDRELRENLAFLDRQMGETMDPQLRDKILSLMASHIEGSVRASATAFDISETPRPPLLPEGPRRGLLLTVALLASLIIGALSVLAMRFLREAREIWKSSGRA